MTATYGIRHVDEQIRQTRHAWVAAYVSMFGMGMLIALLARRRLAEPFLGLSLGLFVLVAVGWLVRPRATLYVALFLTAVSDIVTVSWFPFVKNFSSRESISFVADAVTVSPLDISLALGFAITSLSRYADTGKAFARTALTAPIMVFTAFVAFGFARGIVLGGGDLRIAVLEGRALFYLVLVFGIVTNVCTEPAHLRIAMWWLLGGVFVQVLLSIDFFSRLDPATRDSLESLNEHGSGLGHNLLLLALLALFLFRARAPLARLALAVAVVPTIYVFLVAQRRSAVAALGCAVVLLLVVVFWRHRRLFWVMAPITTLLTIGYLGVFWNSGSAAGFPAQAIKTVIAPQSASAADQSSDLYRMIETYDLIFTIRTDPFKGLGFGRAFYRPVPLPALENFELGPYLPHNSVLWLWIKIGFGGFVTMFYLFGKAVMLGADRLRRLPDGVDVVTTLIATLFIVMFAIYTFVDVSWDARNMVFLGLAFAICSQPVPERASGRSKRGAVESVAPST